MVPSDSLAAEDLRDRTGEDCPPLADVDAQRSTRKMDAHRGLTPTVGNHAAAAAAALDPEARVAPTPRSQTSTVRSLDPSARTNWTLVRPGKRS